MDDNSKAEKNTRVIRWRFMNKIKPGSNESRSWSRLIAKSYSDNKAAGITVDIVTIQHLTQRIILSMAVLLDYTSSHSRDITQAYI